MRENDKKISFFGDLFTVQASYKSVWNVHLFFQLKVCERDTSPVKMVYNRIRGWMLGQGIELCRVAPLGTMASSLDARHNCRESRHLHSMFSILERVWWITTTIMIPYRCSSKHRELKALLYIQYRLTGTASDIMPQANPVMIRPV